MEETSTFSSSGAEAISRQLDSDQVHVVLSEEHIRDQYDTQRVASELISGNYKRIALQFPDELLPISVSIYRQLKRLVGEGHDLFVLADTSYGSCCVDEVAAQHVDADVVVHYGHACMSKTSRLPVIYVFGKKPLDVVGCASHLAKVVRSKEEGSNLRSVLLKHDVRYAHRAEDLLAQIKEALPEQVQLIYTPLPFSSAPSPSNATITTDQGECELPALVDRDPSHCIVLYVGDESLGLTNLLLTHSEYEVYSYNPDSSTFRLESVKTNKLLMRRYAVLQRARDADVFGILVGTLGVASYLPLITHLRSVLKRAQKKSYTISVGKLNPAKLGNFAEIECFVLVACPENSLVDAKEFQRPIVTPYELEIALKAEPSWTGRYVLDFEALLTAYAQKGEDGTCHLREDSEEEDPDQPIFSLVTGKYRQARRYGGQPGSSHSNVEEGAESTAVAIRNQENALATIPDSAAGQFLLNRTFKGLETRLGEDAPSVLEQGRSGIARGYQDDHR
ncbi:diphthamide biosynthesis protein [Punctularia strigosozonata HHB-11173 SS5]|uniref:2-(3-amino-3-carboxypropyl)histidine synthase subunit 2 n=1 Tax=Punctularia strigosozonata (strain HHB-11173) TaxID=741275 RepID=R7S239_PUNST|nr:diphthamide biosynthesis protein [Punctularia strigosozonata HHB-11173 SS5]EIN04475.1 diphthamide biosynthesis protein [Punctularia strigosozonata HHB-11173 SS5]